jgi:hypothetical protein
MKADEPVSARSLSLGLLLFGMLWLIIALTQDFDLAGGAKAIMLLGLAVATVGLTLEVEGNGFSPRTSTAMVAGLGLVLVVFAVLTPSRLTMAETVAATGLAAMPLALRFVGVRIQGGLGHLIAVLTLADAVLIGSRAMIAFGYFHAPDMEDIGTTTIAAVQAVLAGHNPYATPIDLHPEYPDYPGYKYLPMMMAAYAPLALSGEVGLRLTNLILDLGVSAAIFLSAMRIRGSVAGMLALAAWLMLPVLPRDIYKHGVTDLAPVLPLVIALLLAETRLGRAGLLIGLSVAAKLFPGLLVTLCCLRRQRIGFYLIGGVVGILPAVAFYLWGPVDFTRNVFLFILSRPMDETSWMFGLPAIVPMLAKLAYFLFLLAVLAYLVVVSPGMVRRCGLIVLAVIGALLTGPDAHNNYMIWWVPFFCILLGSLVSSIITPQYGTYWRRA